MHFKVVLATIGISVLWLWQHEPTLDASSLIELQRSYERIERELRLSAADAAALEEAIDVLVGDATRELIASRALRDDDLGPADRRLEASILAPVDGLSFQQALSAATARKTDEMNAVLTELASEKATASSDRTLLGRIEVIDAFYWMSVETARSSIDLTIRNGSDRALSELVLDCRLVEPERSRVLESGTCRIRFPNELAPGQVRVARAWVSWPTEPRSSVTAEAWAIQAYGAGGSLLWDIPSRLQPRQQGRVAALTSQAETLAASLRSLGASPPVAR